MKPSGISSWFNSAKQLYGSGHKRESRKLLIDLNRISPGFDPALDLLSIIDFELNNLPQARKWLETLLKNHPDNADFINRQVMVIERMGDIPEMRRMLDIGLKLNANHPGLLYNSIKINTFRGDQRAVQQHLEKIPSSHPLHTKSQNFLNNFNSNRRLLNESVSEAYKTSDWSKALNIYEEWLKKNDPSADSYYNMGLLYMKTSKYPAAIEALKKCYELEPVYSIATFLYLWYVKLMICNWSNYEDAVPAINKGISGYLEDPAPDYDIPIYILSFFEFEEQIFPSCGTKAYQRILNKIEKPEDKQTVFAGHKIRLGYLSSAFWEHPVGRVYKDLFALHNRDKCEIFVYSSNHKTDMVSEQIVDGADCFRDLTGLETKKAYAKILNDRIDILFIVGGHGDDMNMALIAMKPAPIVINAHGYNESLGGHFADYLVSDSEVIDDRNRDCFTEKIITLPRCSIPCSSLPDPVLKPRSQYGLPDNQFIFLSAAHPRKITPNIFELWQDILFSSPDSILWIFDFGIKDVKENLIKSLKYKELENRMFFSGFVPYAEHLGRYHLADLLLDTPIYNCHSVGMEALQSGLPFLTLKGQNSNSRFGSSMLRTSGLTELICHSKDEYAQKAIALSKDPKRKNDLKKKLQNDNPLFNTADYVKEMERCFEKLKTSSPFKF